MADLASLSIKVDSRDINRAKRELDGLSTSAGKADQSAQRASSAFAGMAQTLKAAAAALATFQAAAVLVRFSDEATKFTAQLKLATRSTEEFARAQADVQRIARIAQQDIGTTGVLYARLAGALRDLGANSTQIANVTESVALALKVSGASAQEASSAMLQLSQAFASGVLRGEEFNSVSEAAPRLMRLLADSLGVPIGKLREMAKDGELTADKVANALIPAVEGLRKEAQQTTTISGAFTVLRNEVVAFVAELNRITAVGENLQRSVPLWVDALRVGLKGIAIAGLTVKVVFEALGTAIGAIAAAVMFLVNGEFANAANVMKNFAGDVMSMGKGFIDATKAVLDYQPATGAAATTTELLANTTGKADKAAEKAAKAYAKLRETFAAQVQDLMRYIELVQMGVSAEEANLRVQLERQGALQGEVQTIIDLTAERDALTQSIENEAKARQELADNIEAQRKAALRDAESIEQQAKAQMIANEAYGKTGVALAILTERRNLDRAAELERFATIVQGTDPQLAEAYMRQAAAIRELADARIEAAGKLEDAERAKEQLEAQTKEARKLEDVFRDVGRSLTDSLFRSFESGKGFLRSFVDSIKNTFKALVIRFAVQPVLTSVVGSIAGAFGFSGAANAAGNAANLLGGLNFETLGNIFSNGLTGAISNGLSSLSGTLFNSGFTGASSLLDGLNKGLNIGSSFLTSGIGSIATSLGGSLSAAGFAGAANFVNGFGAGLTGGFSAISGTGGAFSVGGALGAAAPFIGGALALGSLFGLFKKKKRRTFQDSIEGTVSSGFEVSQVGGGTGAAKTLIEAATNFSTTVSEITSAFNVLLDDPVIKSSYTIFAKGKRLKGAVGQFSADFGDGNVFSAYASTGAKATRADSQAALRDVLEEIDELARTATLKLLDDVLTDTMTAFLNALDLSKFKEGAIQIAALVKAQDVLVERLNITADQVVQMADSTTELGARIEQLNRRIGEQFVTQALVDESIDKLTQSFADLGLSMPRTSEGFTDVVRAIDRSTPAGMELTEALLDLGDAFDIAVAQRDQLDALTRGMRAIGIEAEVTQELLSGSGGYAALLEGLNAIFDDQTPLEQFTDNARTIAQEFANVGAVMPATRAAMLQLIQTAGPELRGSLIALYPAFSELIAAGEALNPTLEAVAESVLTVEEAHDQLRSGYDALVSALDGATSDLIDAYARQGDAISDAAAALQSGLQAEIGRQQDIVNAATLARDDYLRGLETEKQRLLGVVAVADEARGVLAQAYQREIADQQRLVDARASASSVLARVYEREIADQQGLIDARESARSVLIESYQREIEINQRLIDARDQAREAYVAGLEREQGTLRQVADQFRRFGQTLRDTAAEVLGIAASNGAPDALRQQFASVSARARLGDADALEQLPALASALANALPDFSRNREELSLELALVSESLRLAAETADRTVVNNETRADILQSTIDSLIGAEPSLEALRLAYVSASMSAVGASDNVARLDAEMRDLSPVAATLTDALADFAVASVAAAGAQSQIDTLATALQSLEAPLPSLTTALADFAVANVAAAGAQGQIDTLTTALQSLEAPLPNLSAALADYATATANAATATAELTALESDISALEAAQQALSALRQAHLDAADAATNANTTIAELKTELAALAQPEVGLQTLRDNLAALVPAGSTAGAELTALQSKIDALQPPVLAVSDALTAYNSALAAQQTALQAIKEAGLESVLTEAAEGVTSLIAQVQAAAAASGGTAGSSANVGQILADAANSTTISPPVNTGVDVVNSRNLIAALGFQGLKGLSDNLAIQVGEALRRDDAQPSGLRGSDLSKFVKISQDQRIAAIESILGLPAGSLLPLKGAVNQFAVKAGISALDVLNEVQGFATGGAFTNGIVSRPTAFNTGVMGEAGPEAIMPLANIGGSLGVRAQTDPEMLNELRALRAEVSKLRESNERAMFQVAKNTGKTSDLLRDWDDGGRMNVRVEATAA